MLRAIQGTLFPTPQAGPSTASMKCLEDAKVFHSEQSTTIVPRHVGQSPFTLLYGTICSCLGNVLSHFRHFAEDTGQLLQTIFLDPLAKKLVTR